MRNSQPKRNLTFVNLNKNKPYGNEVRRSYVQDIVHKAPIVPKPLECSDVDDAFKEFVENDLGLTVNGKDVPTFTLFSNQRFSEYSQAWRHSDEEGNLILNFKTMNRTTNPMGGENQGGLWNIPGDRYYTILQRSVLEDNGVESWEVYSMKQPYAITLEYRVSFITDLFENLSAFNEMVNDLFKARQFYIRPNNHYIPLILEGVEDESKYSVSDYRFYVQTVKIKALAYIIHEEDIKVEKFPKRIHTGFIGDKKRKVKIDIEEEENEELNNQTINLSLSFKEWHDKAQFEIDTDMDIQEIERDNVRTLRIFVNDTPIYWEKGFKVKAGDIIKVKIFQFDIREKSLIVFKGINPNYTYIKDYISEDISQEPTKHQEIEIE